jgi:PLP dependent protein
LEQRDLKANLEAVQRRIVEACWRSKRFPGEVTLIAVTKSVNLEGIKAASSLGIQHFGENRVQEAGLKIKALGSLQPPPDWHMIGHLQSNKVKTALQLFDVIQSVDSPDLAEFIWKSAWPNKPVLLQVNVAGEMNKGGFSLGDIENTLNNTPILKALTVKGLMTVAPLVDDPEEVRPIFRKLRQLRDRFGLEHLSMGMSNDFEVAIEEGATMVRIGRAIFGAGRSLG